MNSHPLFSFQSFLFNCSVFFLFVMKRYRNILCPWDLFSKSVSTKPQLWEYIWEYIYIICTLRNKYLSALNLFSKSVIHTGLEVAKEPHTYCSTNTIYSSEEEVLLVCSVHIPKCFTLFYLCMEHFPCSNGKHLGGLGQTCYGPKSFLLIAAVTYCPSGNTMFIQMWTNEQGFCSL